MKFLLQIFVFFYCRQRVEGPETVAAPFGSSHVTRFLRRIFSIENAGRRKPLQSAGLIEDTNNQTAGRCT